MQGFARLLALLALLACGGGSTAPDASYRVRGKVVERSGSGADTRVVIAHEAIDAFKDREGKQSGMEAMQMAFGLGPGLDASALRPGTQWQFSFDVRWKREPALLITAAQALPDSEPLELAP